MDKNTDNITVSYETTPNPESMKFMLGQTVSSENIDFKSSVEAGRSPLASKIFGFPWTESIFLGADYITITKQNWVEWEVLADPLSNLIKEHIESGEPILIDTTANNDTGSPNEILSDDTPEVQKIKTIINRDIRPAVALDGGDIVFNRFEDNTVYIHMRGACDGCPSAGATLQHGIEARLKEAIPEVQEVVAL